MDKSTPEPDLVQSAYEDQVELLYKELCAGLNAVGGIPSPVDEQQCLARFKLGLTLARRARELALSALPPAISTGGASSAHAAKSRRGGRARPSAKAKPRR